MFLVVPQMSKIVGMTIDNKHLLLFCGGYLFALWWESVGSVELPVLSSCPRSFRGPIIHTREIPLQDQDHEALGAPVQIPCCL